MSIFFYISSLRVKVIFSKSSTWNFKKTHIVIYIFFKLISQNKNFIKTLWSAHFLKIRHFLIFTEKIFYSWFAWFRCPIEHEIIDFSILQIFIIWKFLVHHLITNWCISNWILSQQITFSLTNKWKMIHAFWVFCPTKM